MIVGWGIVGPGRIAGNFATALGEAANAELRAVCGRNPDSSRAFAERFDLAVQHAYVDVDAMLADERIEAVYIATPHPSHAPLAIRAMRAGKHVLCEKPAGIGAGEVRALCEIAEQTGRFFAEGLMYRHHPQIARLKGLLADGAIGEIRHIEASFGFAADPDPKSRLFDPDLAGGAIFDVGVYPVSFTQLVTDAKPIEFGASGILAETGVDSEAHAVLRFDRGITATLSTSIRRNLANDTRIVGSLGEIRLPAPWTPGRDKGPSDAELHIHLNDDVRVEKLAHKEMLFTFEAEAASRAILQGKSQLSACSWKDSMERAEIVDRWRAEVGNVEAPAVLRISGVLPPSLPDIPHANVEGLDQTVSKLVMGCDNQESLRDAAILWDAFWQAGGNGFDTAFVYGGGKHEAVLGQWLKTRGLAGKAQIIAKGAHTPYCWPEAIGVQLAQSLDRLGLDFVPIYIMHRDNLDVPVGEFVDALNRLKQAGRIGVFGGSNWNVARFREAADYALAGGLEPPRILNNNLSLAVMEHPVWPGCITSNDAATRTFLEQTQTLHLSWSSQARGYFLPQRLRYRLPEATSPETCFGSPDNQERRRRAIEIAERKGVEPHHIATAWVLAQKFPSLALIGPRSAGELASTLPATGVELTASEAAWLNLESDNCK